MIIKIKTEGFFVTLFVKKIKKYIMKKITLIIAMLFVTFCTNAEKSDFSKCINNAKCNPISTNQKAKNMNETSSNINDLKIIFSSSPFNGGVGQLANSFTTSSRIYAKITAEKGSLKDVLKIADNDDGIKIYLELYDEAGEKIKKFASISETFEVSAAQANGKSITLDILPDPAIFSIGKQSDFYVGGAFAYGHNQYTFTQNGNYKVGLFVTNEKLDDWGKPIYGDDIIFVNYFAYNFSAKDAANIIKESQAISYAKNNAIKNAITPLPKQWLEKSSPTVMGFTQAQLITMYQNSFTSKMDAHTVVKFHSTASNAGWTVVNNDFGIPTYRYSNQWYTIFIKYTNGKTCYYQGFGLRQQYNGAGTYGKALVDKNEYHMTDCNAMK